MKNFIKPTPVVLIDDTIIQHRTMKKIEKQSC